LAAWLLLAMVIPLLLSLLVGHVSKANQVGINDLNLRQIIANITVGLNPDAIAYDPYTGYLYIADYGSNSVVVLNPANNQVIANITVYQHPSIAYDPQTGLAVAMTLMASATVALRSGTIPLSSRLNSWSSMNFNAEHSRVSLALAFPLRTIET